MHFSLLLQNTRHATDIAVVYPRDEYCVETVEMSRKVPKTGFSSKSTVHQHVETIYAEQSSITLATGEDVQGWMSEAYVANYVGWFHELVQSLGHQVLSNVVRETRDRWNTSCENVVGVDSDSTCSENYNPSI